MLAALFGVLAVVAAPSAQAAPARCPDPTQAAFLELVNDHRARHGAEPLALSASLTRAADGHSVDMATHDYFSHTGRDGSSPRERMTAAGYPTRAATGENIAAGYDSAPEVFEAWRTSSGHNRNMLDPDYRVVGIGLAADDASRYGEYWTTTFGSVVDAAPTCRTTATTS